MKKLNVSLAIILALLIAAGAYFLLGTNMKVSASARMDGDRIRLFMTMKNGSILPYDYIEYYVLQPDGASLEETTGVGERIPALSSMDGTLAVKSNTYDGMQIEIGYYVLGSRRSVTVNIK